MSEDYTGRALAKVRIERLEQNIKWDRMPGVWDRPAGTKMLVLTEEVGEVAKAVLERVPDEELLAELVQVAAVTVAWIEVILAGNRADGEIKG